VYLSPYESSAHLLLGRIYLRGGRIQDAIDALKISIWSDDTVAARLALAEAFAADRENAAARAELQRVLKRDPSNEDARRILDRLPSP
jgi:cytochrome c-type biogenesis protein CcmH/NrfG